MEEAKPMTPMQIVSIILVTLAFVAVMALILFLFLRRGGKHQKDASSEQLLAFRKGGINNPPSGGGIGRP